MKVLKSLTIFCLGVLLASCMGENYADPEITETPYGNNEIEETKVISIKQLKDKFAAEISASGIKEITEDLQIKAYVTGNDQQGNLYNEFALQDETGAILVSVNQGALYGYLPIGQQVLISLKGLMIGGYGQQAKLGGIYTNSKTGAVSIGRMSRLVWERHFKLIGTADPTVILPVKFDMKKMKDASYLEENCGKLMTITNVKFKDADGKIVFAPNDGSVTLTANAVNRAFENINSSDLVLRTSIFADFANAPMPTGSVDITGIFTRFRNTWQIILLSVNDIQPTPQAFFHEPFAEGQGNFTVVNAKALPEGLDQVWSFDARYGMKATAFKNNTRYETDSWLVSPTLNMSKLKTAVLSFDHAQRYGAGGGEDLHVMYSTSYKDNAAIDMKEWKELKLDVWPDGTNWDFVSSRVDLKELLGNANVHIAFRYTSTGSVAATWEVKNVLIN